MLQIHLTHWQMNTYFDMQTGQSITLLKMIQISLKFRLTSFLLRTLVRALDFLSKPHAFDNISRKSYISDDSIFTQVVQSPCGRGVNNFIRSSYDNESTSPQKNCMVLFLMGQI